MQERYTWKEGVKMSCPFHANKKTHKSTQSLHDKSIEKEPDYDDPHD